MSETGPLIRTRETRPRQVLAWGMWDWGSAAFNAVIVTFIFSVYLVDSVGETLPGGDERASVYYSWALAAAGLMIALVAPIMGQNADARGRRKRALFITTSIVVLCMVGMFFVENTHVRFFWIGLALIAVGSVVFDLAEVPYFAMLRQVSTPQSVGRVSGVGWGLGYMGGIVLLALCYFGFVVGEGDTRGFLDISTADGFNIRVIAVVCAVWFFLFALPLFLTVPEIPVEKERAKQTKGVVDSYRTLFADVASMWREDRRTVYFLAASAVYRDGLAAVFALGAVLAVRVYGIDEADVLIFGIAANVIAAAGSFAAGVIDDRWGPKIVIVGSISGMLIAAFVLLFVEGPQGFWIFGLALCAFVGPAQSASRSFLTRIVPLGREGQAFGLYMMSGRAVSFLGPAMFGLFVAVLGAERWGIIGIMIVLAVGLTALLFIEPPRRDRALDDLDDDSPLRGISHAADRLGIKKHGRRRTDG